MRVSDQGGWYHTLTASQADAAGNAGTATISITLDTVAAAPQALGLSVISGGSGRPGSAVTNTSSPTIFGTGTAGDTILLTAGNQAEGTATVSADGTWQATMAAPLADGTNTVTATAHDLAGNASAPATLQVTVLPAPDASGVTTSDMTSTELAQSGQLQQFTSGTQEVVLADGTLSVSPYTDAAFAARLYEGAFGRAPDTLGLGDWNAHLASGASEATVAASFLNSAEAAASGLDATSDAQFVSSLYQHELGRAPDQPGLASWLSDLQSDATSRAGVLAGFAASAEAEQHWAGLTSSLWAPDPTASLVRSVYETGLGRDAEEAGLKHWTSLFDAGLTAQGFAQDVAATPEFQARHNGQTDQQLVTGLYQSGLGRAPDAAGLSTWVGSLQSGSMSRADVLLGIAASPEATTHLPQLP